MSVAKVTEISATSSKSFEDAIQQGLSRASKTLRNIDWFEVVGIRGGLDGATTYYQVTLKIGFRLED